MTTHPTLPPVVDIETAATLLAEQAPITIIDVRSPAEFASAHIPGSYNVPLDRLPEHRAELRDTLRSPAILVCRSGQRARQAEQVLREADLTQVHVLDGGIAAWERAGKPLRRGRRRWGLERQVRGVAGTLVLAGALGGRARLAAADLPGRRDRRGARLLRYHRQLRHGACPGQAALQPHRAVRRARGRRPPGRRRLAPLP